MKIIRRTEHSATEAAHGTSRILTVAPLITDLGTQVLDHDVRQDPQELPGLHGVVVQPLHSGCGVAPGGTSDLPISSAMERGIMSC